MATSPSTSALGALGDIAKPSNGKSPARTGGNAEKSSFSDVLQGAQQRKPEPPARPATAKKPAEKPEPVAANTPKAEPRSEPPAPKKPATAAAKPAPTGNELPPAGEDLPAAVDLGEVIADLVNEAKAAVTGSDEEGSVDKDATTATADPQVAVVVVAVVPENIVTGAAAALANRAAQVGEGDDAAITTKALSDATTAQKREVPTTPQALNGLVLSGIMPPPTPQPAAPVVDAPPVEGVVDSGMDAIAAATATTTPVATAAASAATTTATTPAADAVDPAAIGVTFPDQGLMLGRGGSQKVSDGSAATDPSLALNVDDGAPAPTAALADNGVGKSAADADRGSFRDTLKQIDTTLAGSATKSDSAPVTSVRESGLRQYLDSSATATKVDVPVGKPGWSDAVAGKVMWMSSQNLSSAEIQMNPPDLGPLSVRVNSHQDQTSVYFTSPHAQVREALDQSLPRLREMMSNQGVQLLDVGVGGQGTMRDPNAFAGNSNGSGNGGGNSRGGASNDGMPDMDIGSVTRATVQRTTPGLLDAYA